MTTATQPTVSFLFPTEWKNYFREYTNGVHIDDIEADFGFDTWAEWIRDHSNLIFDGVDDSDRHYTMRHDFPDPEYQDEEVVCYRYYFRVVGGAPGGVSSSRANLPKHLRISVPEPTKLPLPKEKIHA